jgi:hypothetical protein
MYRLVVFAIAVAVLAGGTIAGASSSSGRSGSAYALVDPNGGSPQLIAAHTHGFTAVSVGPFGQGDYCLTPSPGVDVADPAAVASVEAFYSAAFGIATVRYPTTGPSCPAGQLEVKTFVDTPATALSDQIAFTVLVPQS